MTATSILDATLTMEHAKSSLLKDTKPFVSRFHDFLKVYNPVGYASYTEVYKPAESYLPVLNESSANGVLFRAKADEEGEIEEFMIPRDYFEDPEVWESDLLSEIADDFASVSEILLTPHDINPERVVQVIPSERNRLVAVIRSENIATPQVNTYILNLNTSSIDMRL